MASEAKKRSQGIFGEQMESNSKQNQKRFYKVIKNVCKRKTAEVIAVKDGKGNTVKEEREIMKRWREYIQEQLTISWEDGVDLGEQDGDSENVEQIIPKELDKAIRRMKNEKSLRHERITVEIIKSMEKETNKGTNVTIM